MPKFPKQSVIPPTKGGGGTGGLSKYQADYARQAEMLCLLGATDSDLAGFFEVNAETIVNWKKTHKPFRNAVLEGRDLASARVADALYRRAIGAKVVEQKLDKDGVVHDLVRELPPETSAGTFWLTNRAPDKWRHRQEHLSVNVEVDFAEYVKEARRRFSPDTVRALLAEKGFDASIIEGEAEEV